MADPARRRTRRPGPAQVLADAIGEGDLAGARDIPAVIDTRIRNRIGFLVPLPAGPWSAQGESEHTEIAAWCLETQAWQVLTAGDYQRAADISQAATTLSWLGDKAAEGLARQVLAAIEEPGARPRPRRAALARLDLALALTAADKHDEAAGMTLEAIRSGRLAPVDGRRPREIVLAVAERGVPEAAELTEAYQAACGDGGSRPALP
jgi:hypothetical protein